MSLACEGCSPRGRCTNHDCLYSFDGDSSLRPSSVPKGNEKISGGVVLAIAVSAIAGTAGTIVSMFG